MTYLLSAVRRWLERQGVSIVRTSTLEALAHGDTQSRDVEFLMALPRSQAGQLLDLLPRSRSQYRQDLFVLSEIGFKRNGYFVEFGATDGWSHSNTYILEKNFGWSGILAEPGRRWRKALKAARDVAVDTRCVWKTTGDQIDFNETDNGALSTIDAFSHVPPYAKEKQAGRVYAVETVSLNDLLDQHKAPDTIDYLSIDTEGSELEILGAFDFSRRRISVITCEHNHTSNRAPIHDLLTANGFTRVYESISAIEDWYVRA